VYVGGVEVGDVVQMIDFGVGDDCDIGLVLKTELRRQHSYLDQEQYADVLWNHGRVETVFSDRLRVIRSEGPA
tara:strand:- start:122 stop:340 length:219 start_codon:yes stop_codon:yes gene_type:complete